MYQKVKIPRKAKERAKKFIKNVCKERTSSKDDDDVEYLFFNKVNDPNTLILQEAEQSSNWKQWGKVITSELQALEGDGTWEYA